MAEKKQEEEGLQWGEKKLGFLHFVSLGLNFLEVFPLCCCHFNCFWILGCESEIPGCVKFANFVN